MKNLKLACLATIILAGLPCCQQDPITEYAGLEKKEIAISIPGLGSKAFTETTTQSLVNDGLWVIGIAGDNYASPMINEKFTCQDGVFKPASGRKYYWPEDMPVSFGVVYPPQECYSFSDTGPMLDFRNADEETDLCFGYVGNATNPDGPLNISLAHLLSQVSILVKGEDKSVHYELTGLSIRDYDIKTAKCSLASGSPLFEQLEEGETVFASGVTPVPAGGLSLETKVLIPTDPCTLDSPEGAGPLKDATLKIEYDVRKDSLLVAHYDKSVSLPLLMGKRQMITLLLPNSEEDLVMQVDSLDDWIQTSGLYTTSLAMTCEPSGSGKFTFSEMKLEKGTVVIIDWGDGTKDCYSSGGGSIIPSHIFAGGGSGIRIYVSGEAVRMSMPKDFPYTLVDASLIIFEREADPRLTPVKFESSSELALHLYGDFVQPENFNIYLEYSYDGTDWSEWDWETSGLNFGGNGHPCVFLRGINPNGFASPITDPEWGYDPECPDTWQYESPCFIYCDPETDIPWPDCLFMQLDHEPDDEEYMSLLGSVRVECSGNIMSLIDYREYSTEITAPYCFYNLFCYSPLASAPDLPATSLSEHCYQEMFVLCPFLEEAPALPATTLSPYCYQEMFFECPFLKEAPDLPATSLSEDCYRKMFSGCPSLVKAPDLPATSLSEGCYQEMFSGCLSLTKAPDLLVSPAEDSYYEMCQGCENLNYIKYLGDLTYYKNSNWIESWSGISTTGTFVKSPDNEAFLAWNLEEWTWENSDGSPDNIFRIWQRHSSEPRMLVRFAPGNLYWDGSRFGFEEHQYDFPSEPTPDHIGFFKWSPDASVAISDNFDLPEISLTDEIFAANGGAIEGYTVLSAADLYDMTHFGYSDAEPYIRQNSEGGRSFLIAGNYCMILAPISFKGDLQDVYTSEEWAIAEASGLVAIPCIQGYLCRQNPQLEYDHWDYLLYDHPEDTPAQYWANNLKDRNYAGILYYGSAWYPGVFDDGFNEQVRNRLPIRMVKIMREFPSEQ